jgi:hypothetical protein
MDFTGRGIMRKLMTSLLFSFILLALGAMASLAVSVAGDIALNFMSY